MDGSRGRQGALLVLRLQHPTCSHILLLCSLFISLWVSRGCWGDPWWEGKEPVRERDRASERVSKRGAPGGRTPSSAGGKERGCPREAWTRAAVGRGQCQHSWAVTLRGLCPVSHWASLSGHPRSLGAHPKRAAPLASCLSADRGVRPGTRYGLDSRCLKPDSCGLSAGGLGSWSEGSRLCLISVSEITYVLDLLLHRRPQTTPEPV